MYCNQIRTATFFLNNQLGAIGWLNTLLTSVRAGLIAKLCILVQAIGNKLAPTTERTGLIAKLFILVQTIGNKPAPMTSAFLH
ncbi:hypothetical protein B7486_38770 [cyanobacterium TDX16]|nr:hypothetical protein B7486_38770 [cyanobacterium TDX16]